MIDRWLPVVVLAMALWTLWRCERLSRDLRARREEQRQLVERALEAASAVDQMATAHMASARDLRQQPLVVHLGLDWSPGPEWRALGLDLIEAARAPRAAPPADIVRMPSDEEVAEAQTRAHAIEQGMAALRREYEAQGMPIDDALLRAHAKAMLDAEPDRIGALLFQP